MKAHPILAPVDFSPHSERALETALRFARCFQQPLLVLHVIHDPNEMPGYYSRAFKKKRLLHIEDAAAEMFDGFLQTFQQDRKTHFQKLRWERLLVKGLPAQRILEVADRHRVSMIVLGSRGLTGLPHLFLGSVAERVMQSALVPVTVVKAAPAKID